MPADSGMAFVLVQHLDPVHKSETAALLSRVTRMPVVEASDGEQVKANHVYVIPPNKSLAIARGRLRLTEPVQSRGHRMAVDFFLQSLAEDCLERGVGIILSGTGSDGTLGLRAIKDAGGMAIAQDPETAEHDGMPRNAIAGGMVDHVLTVERMPEVLIKFARHPYVRRGAEAAANVEESDDKFQAILSLVRVRARFDFTNYKRGTIERRVQRRMGVRHVMKLGEYLELLRRDPDEVTALTKDLLISVTHFFREPEAWKILGRQVIRPMIRQKKDERPIRVWVPGCATGEEAYTLLMLLFDEISAAGKNCGVQMFASDVNREAFATARMGVYPESVAAEISAPRLRRYFSHEGDHYRVRGEMRDAVVFAEHNLLTAPPFSRLDLISCRNLMIYLDAAAQKKVLAIFHYALRDGGCLFLGSAETIGDREGMFEPISRKWRIYRRIGPSRPEAVEFPLGAPVEPVIAPSVRASGGTLPPTGARFTELAQQLVLDRYAPACVVVNRKNEIMYTCGPTQHYLTQPAGVMNMDLLAWVPDSLRPKLRAILKQARVKRESVSAGDLRIRRGKAVRMASVTVEPLKAPRNAEGLTLITFRDTPRNMRPAAKPVDESSEANDEPLIRQLEDDLQITREDLQGTIDQLESANEELKASNEEVTSVNEELQSTNEELETSKEELQSLNEELSTVNNQLQVKVEELEIKTNDLNNLLSSTDIATLFLDREFQVKWFTAPTTRLLRLRPSDIGRPIGDLAQKFTDGDLLADAEEVLRKLTPIEREIRSQDDRWHLRRVLPYRTADNRIDGVVITFVDIHNLKIAEEGVRRLGTVLRDSNDAVILQDFDGRILEWNRGAQQMFGYTQTEAMQLSAMALVPKSLQPETQRLIDQFKRGQKTTVSEESQRLTKDDRVIDVWMTMTVALDDDGRPMGVATTQRDITRRKRDEAALRELNQTLEKRVAERTEVAEQQAVKLRELMAQLLTTEEHERRSLASDLHDNLAQVLHVAKMKLSEQLKAATDAQQRQATEEVEKLISQATQSARSLTYQLSPPVLYELGLIPAVEWLGEEMHRLYGLRVAVKKQGRLVSPDERIAAVLFRAVRELLINVSKHSGVQQAKVDIQGAGDRVRIVIEDHGKGFDPKIVAGTAKSGGFGLFNIRERLSYLGGTMDIRSKPGKKTEVTLAVPIAKIESPLREGRV